MSCQDLLIGDISIPLVLEAHFIGPRLEDTIISPILFDFLPPQLQNIDILWQGRTLTPSNFIKNTSSPFEKGFGEVKISGGDPLSHG
jgi:hypothetical protein